MEIDYKGIGNRIRAERLALGLSQEKLADAVDLSKPHMSHIESGSTKVSLPTLLKIANALQCTLDSPVMDSLVSSRELYLSNISGCLRDCTADELAVMESTIRSLKESLRRWKMQQAEQ